MILSFDIAGYIINISFSPTEWPAKRSLLEESINTYFGSFKVPFKKKCNVEIIFKEISGIPFLINKKKTYSQCFRKIKRNVYETYYHISIFELSQLILIILIELLSKNGFLLHASGIVINRGVVLFTGESKSGKSTIMHMLSNTHLPFSDDCVVVKKVNKRFVVYQVPWIEKGGLVIAKNSIPHPLLHIFVAKKNKLLDIRKLNTSQLLFEIVKNAWIINPISKDTAISINSFIASGVQGSYLRFSLQDLKKIKIYISNLIISYGKIKSQ